MTAVEFEGEGLVVGEYNGVVGIAHPTFTDVISTHCMAVFIVPPIEIKG
jgi:hypothetical protein